MASPFTFVLIGVLALAYFVSPWLILLAIWPAANLWDT